MGSYVSRILTYWLSSPSCSYCIPKTSTHISQNIEYSVIIIKQLEKKKKQTRKQNIKCYLYQNYSIAQQGTAFDI